MERLTKRTSSGDYCPTKGTNEHQRIQRLAAYEEKGQEPEDILSPVEMAKVAIALNENTRFRALTADIPLDRLTEICAAEREGRLVVLPAKNGDTVYAECSTGIPGEDDAVISWMLSQITMQYLEGTEYWAVGDDDGFAGEEMVFTDNDIGKTVFLTREEAEAALKGGTP